MTPAERALLRILSNEFSFVSSTNVWVRSTGAWYPSLAAALRGMEHEDEASAVERLQSTITSKATPPQHIIESAPDYDPAKCFYCHGTSKNFHLENGDYSTVPCRICGGDGLAHAAGVPIP